ncbi:MAG: PAAR domain-containing protein [Anaerolineae bacterium]|nr:PAAR domain-containing protein [Chloroflexota bacterium]MBN8637088.1 PAAR domain-containing protein [Anaerolineae bacterium]
MGQPAAKQGDRVQGVDIHITLVPSASGTTPVPLPYMFNGIIDGGLSQDVTIQGRAAATVNSTATNTPAHIPMGNGFQTPPKNKATLTKGSATVTINGKPAARMGDTALTCNDPSDLPNGTVIAVSTVLIGG